MSTIILTTGVPGSGKTYVRCARFLVDDFLINGKGVHYSNFPVNADVIAEDVHKRLSGKLGFFARLAFGSRKIPTVEELRERIKVIPEPVMQSWRQGISGPWDYFKDIDLKYAHIAIDEIHEIVKFSSPVECLEHWDEFLGTIRHRGCTIEGLTQDISSVDRCFTSRASIRYELTPCEDLRDPYFNVPLYDWYQLKAAFTGEYHKSVVMHELKKTANGRFKANHHHVFAITPEYFKYYNSYSKTLSGGNTEDEESPKSEYQTKSKIGLVCWFLRRNIFNILPKLVLVGVFIWLAFFGGGLKCFMYMMKYFEKIHQSNIVKKVTKNNTTLKNDAKANKTEVKTNENEQNPETPSIEKKILNPEEKAEFLKNHEYMQIVRNEELLYEAYNYEKELIERTQQEEKEKVLEEIRQNEDNKKKFGELKYIDGETAFFNNGEMLKRGQKFVRGHYYEGRSVTEINYRLGFVRLDDDTIIKLSVSQ